MLELPVSEGFEKNPKNLRGFRIGIDASIWFFHAEYGKEGELAIMFGALDGDERASSYLTCTSACLS